MSSELKLIPIVFLCAFLSIIGHFILSSLFSEENWLEYIAAVIPIKFAAKNDNR